MTEIEIDKKKYILIPEKNYLELQKRAAMKSKPEKTLVVSQFEMLNKKRLYKNLGMFQKPASSLKILDVVSDCQLSTIKANVEDEKNY